VIVAVDVHYRQAFAKAVSIEFEDWADAQPARIHEVRIEEVAAYEPGQFYKRELPCILKVLACTPLERVSCIVVDGYVTLGNGAKPGLGKYLYDHLNQQIPVIGVAKRSFHDNGEQVAQLLRGESKNPLFLTAAGMPLKEALAKVKFMQGGYRMPDLLRILDQQTKQDT